MHILPPHNTHSLIPTLHFRLHSIRSIVSNKALCIAKSRACKYAREIPVASTPFRCDSSHTHCSQLHSIFAILITLAAPTLSIPQQQGIRFQLRNSLPFGEVGGVIRFNPQHCKHNFNYSFHYIRQLAHSLPYSVSFRSQIILAHSVESLPFGEVGEVISTSAPLHKTARTLTVLFR